MSDVTPAAKTGIVRTRQNDASKTPRQSGRLRIPRITVLRKLRRQTATETQPRGGGKWEKALNPCQAVTNSICHSTIPAFMLAHRPMASLMKLGLSLVVLVAAMLLSSSVFGRESILADGSGGSQQPAPGTAAHRADGPTTGSYASADGFVYIGMDGDPSHPQLGYYDEHTRRLGTLLHAGGQHYRSMEA
ncbi:MAG: hypothetical protein M3R20_00045, partial [Pseudomonadota bacterium]|nr:hypothetical protein [Pseudomonadota bacterium]